MPKIKPQEWKADLEGLVAEGKTYAQTQAILQEKYGKEEGKVGASTFGKIRKVKFPEDKRVEAIAGVADAHKQTEKKGKSFIKVDHKWSTAKQKAGDTSQLAKVLNQVIFYVVPCKSGKLVQKDVDDINLGGGIVNTVSYLFPGLDFSNNPIVTLVIRIGLLMLKVQRICNNIRDRGKPHENDVIGAPEDGSNPDYVETQPKGINIADIFSEHPTDKYMREEGLLDPETTTK